MNRETPTPDPPPTAPLTAEEIAAIRANAVASRANGYPYIACATVIAMADEIVALRDRLARAEERERAAMDLLRLAKQTFEDAQRLMPSILSGDATPTDGAARAGER